MNKRLPQVRSCLRTSSTSRATFSGGVCGTMPWPRLKMNGLPARARQNFADPLFHGRLRPPPAAADRGCPARPRVPASVPRASASSGIAVSQPTPSTPVSVDVARGLRPRAARKSDDRHVRMPRLQPVRPSAGSARPPSAGTGRRADFRPSCRKSARTRRRPRPARRDTRRKPRPAGRSAAESLADRDRPTAAPSAWSGEPCPPTM